MRGLTLGLVGILFGIGIGSMAMEFRHRLDYLHPLSSPPNPAQAFEPIIHDIVIEGSATWAELFPLLQASAETGEAVCIRVNGGPMYLPCYSPYEDGHHNLGVVRYGPWPALTVVASTSLAEIDRWVAGRELRGTWVQVSPRTSVTRVSALARLLDARRHTATWSTLNESEAEFVLTEAAVFSFAAFQAEPETVQPSDAPK